MDAKENLQKEMERSLKLAIDFRENVDLPNPNDVKIVAYYHPQDDVVARADEKTNGVLYNLYFLFLDYLQFGKIQELKEEANSFIYTAHALVDQEVDQQMFDIASRMFKEWNDEYEISPKTCIPVSVIFFQLEHLIFRNKFKMPEDPEKVFLYFSVDETIGYYVRDYFFRGLKIEEINMSLLNGFLQLQMKRFIWKFQKLPSVETYKKFFEFQENIKKFYGEKIKEIYKLYEKSKDLDELLENLE